MNVLESMLSLQNSLTEEKTFCQMIRTIFANLDFIKTATIYDVAELCYTSTASVGRLCNRLGYQSFTVFRAELNETMNEYALYRRKSADADSPQSAFDRHISILQAKLDAVAGMNAADFERAADLLHQKDNVHFFTHFSTSIFSLALQRDLTVNSKHTFYHCFEKQDLHPGSLLKQDTAAVFVISNLPSENPIIQSVREAIQSPASTIVFAMRNRTLWEQADVAILLPGSDTSFTDMNLAMYAMELLTAVYCAKYIGPRP